MTRSAPAVGETLTIRRFASCDEAARVTTTLRWDAVPLPPTECSETAFAAKLAGKNVSVSIASAMFQPDTHTYDTANSGTIDGRPSLGHDGIASRDYAIANFSNARVISEISVRFAAVTRRIPKQHFLVMLRPHFTDGTGCGITAYWIERRRLVVVAIGGGDGAGAYETYLLFDRTGFRGQYSAYAPTPDYFFADSLDYFGFGVNARLGFDPPS